MTSEQLIEIFSDTTTGGSLLHDLKDDNAFLGLKIIRKYLPRTGIEGAEHDMIYSVDIDKLCEAGITVEDAKQLHAINWHIEDDEYMACFV